MKRRHIVGIGADIEEIGRFEDLDRVKNRRFLTRIYTHRELSYCFAKRKPAQHLAARFCAKESVIKALSRLGIRGISYRDIRVRSTAGAPSVALAGVRAKFDISLTMAHAGGFALAAALVKKV